MVLDEHGPHQPLSAWCGLAWLLWQPCTACLWWCLSILRGSRSATGLVREKYFLKKDKIPQIGLVQVPSCPDRARGCGGWYGAGTGSSLRGRVGVPQGPRQAVGWPRVWLAPRCRAVREALRGLWVQPAMKGGSAVAFGSHGSLHWGLVL